MATRIKCNMCPHLSGSKKAHEDHIKEPHSYSPDTGMYKCEICELEFQSCRSLFQHIRKHKKNPTRDANKIRNLVLQNLQIKYPEAYQEGDELFCKGKIVCFNEYREGRFVVQLNTFLDKVESSYVTEFEQARNQKIIYTNQSSKNGIIKEFSQRTIFKDVIPKLQDDEYYAKYLANRIIYKDHISTVFSPMNQLTDHQIPYPGSYPSMHPIVNIRRFILDNNSDKVIDPFAGWGHRMTGASLQNTDYLGFDINSEQVNNLRDLKEFLNQECYNSIKIVNSDIRYFPVDSDFIGKDVFTCPPYRDVEIYSDVGLENLETEEFQNELVDIFDFINKNYRPKNISIQYTDRLEDDINKIADILGKPYNKIILNQGRSHFTKNAKSSEIIYEFKEVN